MHFEGLTAELFIGGVYVRLFLKNPSFPLRAPKAFLEGLLKAYLADVADGSATTQDRALLVAAAAVELLRAHAGLAEHAVTLGYVDRLLKLLSSRLAGQSLWHLCCGSLLSFRILWRVHFMQLRTVGL